MAKQNKNGNPPIRVTKEAKNLLDIYKSVEKIKGRTITYSQAIEEKFR